MRQQYGILNQAYCKRLVLSSLLSVKVSSISKTGICTSHPKLLLFNCSEARIHLRMQYAHREAQGSRNNNFSGWNYNFKIFVKSFYIVRLTNSRIKRGHCSLEEGVCPHWSSWNRRWKSSSLLIDLLLTGCLPRVGIDFTSLVVAVDNFSFEWLVEVSSEVISTRCCANKDVP